MKLQTEKQLEEIKAEIWNKHYATRESFDKGMNKFYVPPIKIQGIKTKLVEWIISNVDFSKSHRWVEPFMGSGVVGFNFQPKTALFCDSNPHIINFYNAIKDKTINHSMVAEFLKEEGEKLKAKGD